MAIKKPREIFVDISIRSYEGRQQDLKPFFEAAHSALRRLCNERGMFFGVVGRRAVVTRQTFTRHMKKYRFYGKA